MACMWLRMEPLFYKLNIFRTCIPAVTLVILFAKYLQNRSLQISRLFFLDFAFIAVCILLSVLVNPSSIYVASFTILLIASSWLILAYLLSASELERLYETFINLMCLISAVSIPLWILGGILGVLSPTATVTYIWDGERFANTFWGVYFIPRIQMMDILAIRIPKNCGIFAEGTMYGFLLVVAYLLHRNCLRRSGRKRILLAVVIISTLSVSPVLALLMDEAFYFILQKNKNHNMEILRKISIPLFLIGFGVAFLFILQAKSETGSYGVRMDHLLGCLRIFGDSFPFGVGYGERDSLFPHFTYAQGLSVGLPYLLAQGGIGALVILVVKFANILSCSIRWKDVGGIAFAGVFFWISLLTNNTAHPIFWMVLMLVFTSYKKMLHYERSKVDA